MAGQASALEQLLSNFRTFEKGLNGASSSPIHGVRREAIERFAILGFPTTRNEEWRFTNLSPITSRMFLLPTAGTDPVKRESIRELVIPDAIVFAFIDGFFAPQFSTLRITPRGFEFQPLQKLLRAMPGSIPDHLTRHARFMDDAFTALNTGFISDGAHIRIADSARIEKPIQLLYLSTGNGEPYATHPRNLIIAGKNSEAHVVESYAALESGTYFTNSVTEIVVGENAHIEQTKFQNESPNAFHIGTTQVYQGRASAFTSHLISFGGALVRNNTNAVLDGEGIESTLNGLYMAGDGQHVDNHTILDHARPHCVSDEVYRGILDGEGRAVFSGKIIVRPDAQKTDAKQSNKNLLLSDTATIDTKPQLEIYANDVKCTHGATVGQLEEEHLFYLQTRGIAADDARTILTHGFASDIVNRIEIPALRQKLETILTAKLETRNNQ